jgi:hypothetical protein
MNTNEINNVLKLIVRNKAAFSVVPCDLLYNVPLVRYPLCIIANTDDSSKPGSHWVTWFKASKCSPLEFFCSYGMSYSNYGTNFAKFPSRFQNVRVLERRIQLQSFNSQVCGQYALYFIARRIKKCNRDAFYSSFSPTDLKKNDKLVKRLVNLYNPLMHGGDCSYNKTHVQCCKKFNKM